MNRFEYAQAILKDDESFVAKHKSMKLYHGHQKTNFEDGEVVLTTHRLLWGRVGEIARGMVVLSLNLKYVISLDEEVASSFVFGRKKRIIIMLSELQSDKAPGPMDDSTGETFIKLSGRNGIEESFVQSLNETVSARIWETSEKSSNNETENTPVRRIKLRTGIVGIERNLQERQKQTDENITLAFKDLNKLMTMAKDMVAISKVISSKIRERHGDISEDETVRFKSYLMSLGIDDPVTRDSAASNSEYFQLLANQICAMLLDPIIEAGGMMSLADVYCRVNRARGLELLSPEDLLNACQMLDGPIKLRKFPSGAMVLQIETHSDEIVSQETFEAVEKAKSITVEELAQLLSISLLLAQERLLTAERAGKICRDDSIEGLRFYPNLFLTNAIE
ncbi:vacuolar protein-sorting-associated protein 36 [Contarinia nasturtii]|uniref:vacuolar protein-sorting-associated protein 36 n=1 Tax=Contarinia nasturtii TaxID=265458 RepID=UPI0012D44B54|nr:vacuolar protein-sorting-associated protein 36 [Contarinia nasturtii]